MFAEPCTEISNKQESELSEFGLEYAKTIYENERKREDGIIKQAERMQTVNLLFLVSVCVILGIVIEYTTIRWVYLTLEFSSIIISILISLLFATISQHKTKRVDFPNIKDAIYQIRTNEERLKTKLQKSNYLIDLYSALQEAVTNKISHRERFLKISAITFYISLLIAPICICINFCFNVT